MKILITGASGFIGMPILERLIHSDEVSEIYALTRKLTQKLPKNKKLKWIETDISEYTSIKLNSRDCNPDILIHLAWSGIPDFSESQSLKNLNQSINFIDHILSNSDCKKILVAGSCFEYDQKFGECIEESTTKPKDYFTWAKLTLLEYLKLKCKKSNVSFAWFRLFYVYGAGQREGSLLPTLFKFLGDNIVPQLNTPKNANDFVHVDDVALAFEMAITQEFDSGIYNLGRGESVSVIEFCQSLEMLISNEDTLTNKLIKNTSNSVEQVNFFASTSKIKKTFGWVAKTPLLDGLEKSIKNHNG